MSVSRLGEVRKAAQEMNISQPAVSGRIAALEKSLGTILFDRGQRGVTLTKKGVLLRDYAEKIADLVESIKSNIVPAEAVDSLLRIGVDVTVNLRQQLLERSLDLAILKGPLSDYSIDNVSLPAIELTWFRAASEPITDFNTMPVITYNRNSRLYRELRGELIKRYGHESQLFPSSSIYAGLEMVASGIGVGRFARQSDI